MELPTVLSTLTSVVVETACEVGFERAALLAAAGLDESELADPDGRVPLGKHYVLWTVVATRPVGLELGARMTLGALGAVGYALQHGATAGEALAWLRRYQGVIFHEATPGWDTRVVGGERRLVFRQHVPSPFAELLEPVDIQAASTLSWVRALTGRDVAALEVHLQRPRPADGDRHERFFGCPVVWDADAVEVHVDGALLDVPLPRRDPRLFGYLARRADELLAALPAEASFARRARREIGALLAHGEPALADVAAKLAVSERTLHRRLREESTGFAALVEEERRERAFMLLGDPKLSASEVSFLLGYAEPAAFFRAFRRWTGQTPQAWRLEKRSQAAGPTGSPTAG